MAPVIHLYIAPAGAGKTDFVLAQARARALRWQQVRMVVGGSRQAVAAHRRLARTGGAMGVRIQTLFGLARELLDLTASPLTLISDPIQVRFLRSLVDEAGLVHFQPLARMPGFIRALRGLFDELTFAQISPNSFMQEVQRQGAPPRLAELARLYALYRQRMAQRQWMDNASLLELARSALEQSPRLASAWTFLGVDGFMRFRPAEIALLQSLTQQLDATVITLTGDPAATWSPVVAGPYDETRLQVEAAFGVKAAPLPTNPSAAPPSALTQLAEHLFTPQHHPPQARKAVHFVEAPDLAGEVRVALRWLKERLVQDGLQPSQAALLARDISPYRQAIAQTAAEFGLPVRISGGLPLRQNPAVDALLSLLNLVAPQPDGNDAEPDRRFPFRATVSAWRSPYFDWRWRQDETEIIIAPQDADALDRLGRWARVAAGAGQWQDAFDRSIRQAIVADEALAEKLAEGETPDSAPAADEAQRLQRKWQRFCAAITPPAGQQPVHTFVHWLENLIGPEPDAEASIEAAADFSLQMVARIRHDADETLADRDIAALIALKEALRGIIWAAEALQLAPVSFAAFLDDLAGAVEAARYEPRRQSNKGFVQAMSVPAAAGLRFEAVALLGLAEGAFPAVLHEDVFLRGADREQMRRAGLAVAPSPRSEEAALFYLAMSRTAGRMLLTRPRLAQGGAKWQASPYWRTLVAAAGVKPKQRSHENLLDGAPVASLPELLIALASYTATPSQAAMEAAAGERLQQWRHGRRVLKTRFTRGGDAYDGDLSTQAATFARRFGPDHVWSAGRLESYRNCPYRFFATSVLRIAERPEPTLGLDNQQLGSIYHRALELTFREGADKADDAEALIAIWQHLAGAFLDEAPETYGFRPTAWWPQTRKIIDETLCTTLAALARENKGWRPRAFEARFGMAGAQPLAVPHEERAESLLLHGIIDRVDGNGQGAMRVVDYKRGGMSEYTNRTLQEGKYLQLPIYALAASQSLGHGQPVDGFYWSVTRAEASRLRLGKFGVEEAVALAMTHAWEAVEGARAGRFQPQPPAAGCPDFCPAAAFCWHFHQR